MVDSCSTCFFFKTFQVPREDKGFRPLSVCARNAPQSIPGTQNLARWPEITRPAEWWCGDFLQNYPTVPLTWSDWIPAFSSGGAGALGPVTNVRARFATFGKLTTIALRATVDTGTATVSINFTLPNTPNSDSALFGMTSGGLACSSRVTGVSNIVTVQKYDGTMLSGPTMYIGGSYENQ